MTYGLNTTTPTAQQVFDHVYRHMLTQGCRAASPNEEGEMTCRYRGDNRTACAAGSLIPDSRYTPEIEGLRFHVDPDGHFDSEVAGRKALKALRHDLGLQEHVNMITCMQGIHDGTPPQHWEESLRQQAALRGLAVPEMP